MKKALITISVLWLSLTTLSGSIAMSSTSAGFGISQAEKALASNSPSREATPASLYDAHQWFRLRDVAQTTNASALHRGAVAAAFNDIAQAEIAFQSIFQAEPQSEQAFQAHIWLIYLYQRSGRFRQTVAQIDEALKTKPDNPDLKNARALFAAFAQHPEQRVIKRTASRTRYHMQAGNLFIPIHLNGKPSTYIVDTGANFSLISESEAKRLGLMIHEAMDHEMGDSAGLKFGVRIAVADQLRVGNFQLRHVPFIVVRDDQQPFVSLPDGQRGVLGLPTLLAFQTLRWGRDGIFEVGFTPARKRKQPSNMCFEGVQPVVEAEFKQQKVSVFLDTGATKTQLLPLFAREFPVFVKELGRKEELTQVTGISGSIEVKAITLPQLTLRVGGFDAALRPAQILLKEPTPDSRRWHAWVGIDTLNQAHQVSLDFKNLWVALE